MAFMNATERTHALYSSQDFCIADGVLKGSINNFASSLPPFFKDNLSAGPTSHALFSRMWPAMKAYANWCAQGLDTKVDVNKAL